VTAPAGSSRDVIEAAAAHGLPGARPLLQPVDRQPDGQPSVRPTTDWAELIAMAERQRVLGLLAAAVADDPSIELDRSGR
jgi:hypothetical protein